MDRNNNGTFAVGHPGYKPRGAVSEFQKVARTKLGEFLKSKLDDLDSIYEELSAKEKARLLLAAVEFFMPKMKELIIDNELGEMSRYSFDKLSSGTLQDMAALQQKIKLELQQYENTEN